MKEKSVQVCKFTLNEWRKHQFRYEFLSQFFSNALRKCKRGARLAFAALHFFFLSIFATLPIGSLFSLLPFPFSYHVPMSFIFFWHWSNLVITRSELHVCCFFWSFSEEATILQGLKHRKCFMCLHSWDINSRSFHMVINCFYGHSTICILHIVQ